MELLRACACALLSRTALPFSLHSPISMYSLDPLRKRKNFMLREPYGSSAPEGLREWLLLERGLHICHTAVLTTRLICTYITQCPPARSSTWRPSCIRPFGNLYYAEAVSSAVRALAANGCPSCGGQNCSVDLIGINRDAVAAITRPWAELEALLRRHVHNCTACGSPL